MILPLPAKYALAIELLKKLVITELDEWKLRVEWDVHMYAIRWTPAAGIKVTLKYELLSSVCLWLHYRQLSL